MSTKPDKIRDPILIQRLMKAIRKDGAERKFTTPYVRIRRPWLGTLNWERHKRRLANKRRSANKQARMTRKAQRRASRA